MEPGAGLEVHAEGLGTDGLEPWLGLGTGQGMEPGADGLEEHAGHGMEAAGRRMAHWMEAAGRRMAHWNEGLAGQSMEPAGWQMEHHWKGGLGTGIAVVAAVVAGAAGAESSLASASAAVLGMVEGGGWVLLALDLCSCRLKKISEQANLQIRAKCKQTRLTWL
jgi:hypothetical protein